jgi:hypothetical protein
MKWNASQLITFERIGLLLQKSYVDSLYSLNSKIIFLFNLQTYFHMLYRTVQILILLWQITYFIKWNLRQCEKWLLFHMHYERIASCKIINRLVYIIQLIPIIFFGTKFVLVFISKEKQLPKQAKWSFIMPIIQ